MVEIFVVLFDLDTSGQISVKAKVLLSPNIHFSLDEKVVYPSLELTTISSFPLLTSCIVNLVNLARVFSFLLNLFFQLWSF